MEKKYKDLLLTIYDFYFKIELYNFMKLLLKYMTLPSYKFYSYEYSESSIIRCIRWLSITRCYIERRYRSRNIRNFVIIKVYETFFDLTASFYLASVTYGRSLERGQQPTFHVFSHWYFRYYLEILCMYYILQTSTWTITRALTSSFPFVLLVPTCPFELRFTPFSFYFWPRPELRPHRLRVLILTGNPEFRARDEQSFVIFSVHVNTYVYIRTVSIELHFGAKRHLPLIPWRCENNGLQRVYIFAFVPLYPEIRFK